METWEHENPGKKSLLTHDEVVPLVIKSARQLLRIWAADESKAVFMKAPWYL